MTEKNTQNSQHSLVAAAQILDGGDSYLQRLGLEYMLTFIENTPYTSPTAYNICRYFEQSFDEIEGFPSNPSKATKGEDEDDQQKRYPNTKRPQRNAVDKEDWDLIKAAVQEKLDELPNEEPSLQIKNLETLSDHLRLSTEEKNALRLLFVAAYQPELSTLLSYTINKVDKEAPAIARILNDEKNYKTYAKILSPNGKLAKYDIINPDSNQYSPLLLPSDETDELLNITDLSGEDIKKALVGNPTTTELGYDDFHYLGEDLDYIIDLVRNAATQGIPGVNILLDGPTGGGKTELAKVIMKEAGLDGYSIGESEDMGGETPGHTISDEGISVKGSYKDESSRRFSQLLRAQTLLADDPNSVLMLDEIEDLLIKGTDSSKSADTSSKIAINNFMVTNKRPNIFCGNNPEKFDPSVRNRFTFSLFVDYPSVKVREQIWKKQLEIQGVSLPDEEVTFLSRKYDASPRQITYAIKGAKVTGTGLQAIERSLPASARITSGSRTHILDRSSVSENYKPSLLNVAETSSSTPEQVIKKGENKVPFSLLIQGVSGTGVKTLSRAVAESLFKNPLETSVGGLIADGGPLAPPPAARIRGAFEQAANLGRILVVHDLEQFAGPNPKDENMWKRSPLAQLFFREAQQHNHPFIVTTSKLDKDAKFPQYMQNLFSDKIKLDPMTSDQIKDGFQHFFNVELPEDADLSGLNELTIGDMTAVRHRIQRLEDHDVSADRIIAALKQQRLDRAEIAGQAKSSVQLGFHPS